MSESNRKKRIAIVGAGLSGLTAAFRLLQQTSYEQQFEITLYEKSSRIGGVFGTVEQDGYRLETGADSFITNKPQALQLCEDLRLTERLISTQSEFRRSLILHQGKPVPTPKGFNLMVPQQLWPLLSSPLLSVRGKLRVLGEILVRSNPQQDESLSGFVTRRFGRELMENIVQPMIGGIYTADPEKLSLRATLPRFLEMEAEYGSLLKSIWKNRKQLLRSQKEKASGVRYGLFASLKEGMSELLQALWQKVEPQVDCQLGTQVEQITFDSASKQYTIQSTNAQNEKQQHTFDALILATPGQTSAKLARDFAPQWSQAMTGIEYASSAIVVTGHRLADIEHNMDAFGLVIPNKENRQILAVSFTSRKFAQRAPEGSIQLRTFVGGAMQPENLKLNDDQLTELVLKELAEIFGVSGTPETVKVARWNQAMPQYHVGHLEKVERIKQLQTEHPNFESIGNALDGVGLPDVIATATAAVKRLLETWDTKKDH